MKVEVLGEDHLQGLRQAWTALLDTSASDTVFLTCEWIEAWWSAYGKSGELMLLAAFDDDGTLVGLAPLRSHQVQRCGRSVPALSFAGDHTCDSDYLDFVISRGREVEVIAAFRQSMKDYVDRGRLVLLNEIPERSPNLPLLRDAAVREKMLWKEEDVPCGAVDLPSTWDEYLKQLKPRFRTKVRSVLRSLESNTDVQFGFCQSAEEVERLLPILFDLHSKRWAGEGMSGVFGWDLKRRFYAALSPRLLERDWFRFSWLAWKGRVLACQYGFVYKGTYFQLQEGYDPACEHWNPGIGLRAWCIRRFIADGVHTYDFMAGVGRNKTDWGAVTKVSKRTFLASDTLLNRLLRKGPELTARLRASSAGLLRVTNAKPKVSRVRSLKTTMAGCYLRSGLPRLTRFIRDRYQLGVSGNGNGRKLTLHKRQEPTARILYYHRVNNDGDPFFPALATNVFEEQIAYVARYHRVVSLGEALEHLERDSAEPVVAITFDDGYEDNYQNAFPILQRYGVPATIFLTTGSMDNGEPLWFEQLAEALKKTDRQSLDLDIDLPRRFSMRKEAERLEANAGIYAALRKLSDPDRRYWLEFIVRELGCTQTERRNKLLRWEQVRHMAAHGISFGGHTVNHPFLSSLAPEQVTWELTHCKRRIEEELQTGVEHFAYPSGRTEDFGLHNKDLVRAAGYRAAVTTIWGMNFQSTDRMELRRGGPWEEHQGLYACKMDWYQMVND